MKKVLLITAAMLFVFIFSNSFCEKNYELEKAIINYRMSGMMTGTMELIFDKYGDYISTTTESPDTPKSTIIETPETTYMINWNDKIAMDMGRMDEDMMDDSFPEEADDFEANSTKAGTEKILGKNAAVYIYKPEEGGTVKYWIWKGLMLKSITEIDGMTSTIEATSLETPGSIPAKTFKVPAGITVQKLPSFSLPIPGFGN